MNKLTDGVSVALLIAEECDAVKAMLVEKNRALLEVSKNCSQETITMPGGGRSGS